MNGLILTLTAITALATVATAAATVASFLNQRRMTRANVVFFFKKEGNRLIPCISNNGRSLAREITVKTNPMLLVVGDIDKKYEGYQRTYSLELLDSVIHTLEVGQTIEDYPGFDIASFKRQFVNYSTIYANVSFISENTGRKYVNAWQLDIAPLTVFSES